MATVPPSTSDSGAPPLVIAPLAPPPPIRMTAEEFLALPDDGMDRDLIRGELREWGMTVRNRFHTKVATLVAGLLHVWWRTLMGGRGELHSADVGCYLNEQRTLVGIDVAYFDQATIDAQTDATKLIVGPPVLAVEVASPNDTIEKIQAKTGEYLSGGVKQVWVVNPYDRTVAVYRPGLSPDVYNDRQELRGDPELPGFHAAVSEFFE